MANEIIHLGRSRSGNTHTCRFLYLFDMTPPISFRGELIVPTPAKNLPEMFPDMSSEELFTTDEIARLDAGTMVFLVDQLTESAGMDVTAAAQARYGSRDPKFVNELREQYSELFTGGRIDKPGGGRP